MPVTLTVAVNVSHAVPMTCAITVEYFISIGVDFGAARQDQRRPRRADDLTADRGRPR